MPAVGFLSGRSPGDMFAPWIATFIQGLSETGHVEGRNLTIDYRWADGHYDRLPALAAELVDRKVDVIVATGGPAPALAAKAATTKIPIVFTGADAIADGLVADSAHPGGNITGISPYTGLVPMMLELISRLVPTAAVIALLVNPTNPNAGHLVEVAKQAAQAQGVRLALLKAGTETEIDSTFAEIAELRAGALVVGNDAFFSARRDQLVALAARHAMPTIYFVREFAASGGLISLGPGQVTIYYQAGVYAGRILNGEHPADLPVQQPKKFELVINLKTARALGLIVPPSIISAADKVIG